MEDFISELCGYNNSLRGCSIVATPVVEPPKKPRAFLQLRVDSLAKMAKNQDVLKLSLDFFRGAAIGVAKNMLYKALIEKGLYGQIEKTKTGYLLTVSDTCFNAEYE